MAKYKAGEDVRLVEKSKAAQLSYFEKTWKSVSENYQYGEP
jgi:hypothetical protein